MERERERLQVRILPRPYTLHLGCLLVYDWHRHYSLYLLFPSVWQHVKGSGITSHQRRITLSERFYLLEA